mmetsp:Transcript_26029/g.81880  ORF Transcript_26029/g.81880 Transcript_26029/m.81880 type:complete len:252 (+) Transcript_26029:734-1489(+)
MRLSWVAHIVRVPRKAGEGGAGGGVSVGLGAEEGVGVGAGTEGGAAVGGAGGAGAPPAGPSAPNCEPTCFTNSAGHSTALNFTLLGSPLFQPQDAKSLQPFRNCAGSWSQRCAHSAVFAHCVHQLPSVALCCWLSKPVPGRRPQTFAVDHCRLSKPGAATSKCGSPAPQPLLQGGQRFFFMTTAVHSGWRESGFCTSAHLPQPPTPPSLGSAPQHPSSAPMRAERASEAAPVSHMASPYAGPPKSAGSCGP